MQEMLRMTPIMVQERTQRPQILFHHDEASCIVSYLRLSFPRRYQPRHPGAAPLAAWQAWHSCGLCICPDQTCSDEIFCLLLNSITVSQSTFSLPPPPNFPYSAFLSVPSHAEYVPCGVFFYPWLSCTTWRSKRRTEK